MARIYLDARNITAQPAGVARYAQSLIPELVRQASHHEFIVIRHSSNQTPLEIPGHATDHRPPNLREVFIDLPIDNLLNFLLGRLALTKVFAENGPADIYHDLFHILPRNAARTNPTPHKPCKIVLTLHDFVWLDHARQSQATLRAAASIQTFARIAIPYALRHADHVISISEPTTRRAADWIDRSRITTISHGVDPVFFQPTEPPTDILPGLITQQTPYIVAIGNHKKYKNLGLLIDAFAKLRAQTQQGHLVLIGDCQPLAPLIARQNLENHITLTGFLSDQQLRQVLGHARAFVFPSLIEGFGLPILEAMAMGIPTVICDREPMRSIAGDAALRFHPYAPSELARILQSIFRNDALHLKLSQASLHRARQFTWPLTAQKTLAVYDQLLAT